MSHFHNKAADYAQLTTPKEWLVVGSQIGKLVNDWSERSDLVVSLGDYTNSGAPALYTPDSAEIEIGLVETFGERTKPEHIDDLRLRKNQLDWPTAIGAVFHESAHARFSRFSLEAAAKELTSEEFEALVLLEEGRIEAFGVRFIPQNKVFLRASALNIVMKDIKSNPNPETSNVRVAANMAGLVLARHTAGVLDSADIEPVRKAILKHIPEETLGKLEAIWTEYQSFGGHYNIAPMYPLAREWVKIVTETSKAAGEPQPGEQGSEGSESVVASAMGDLMEALADSAANTSITVAIEAQDAQTAEEWKETVSESQKKSNIQKDSKASSNKVFNTTHAELAGSYKTHSKLVEERPPTPDERVASVRLAQQLERAKYRERSITETASELPPGRLRTRALVQGTAARQTNVFARVEPWQRKVRKHTDDPNLSVGIMVDISGSMVNAMKPMATTAWVLSEAGRRIQAQTAMVYFGQDVFPVLKKGQHLDKVSVYSANDGTEKFDMAFKALNGSLNLIYGNGARMLVVVSDGNYTTTEAMNAQEWISLAAKEGVAVVWVNVTTPNYHLMKFIEGIPGAISVEAIDKTPTEIAGLIGKAATKVIESIGDRR